MTTTPEIKITTIKTPEVQSMAITLIGLSADVDALFVENNIEELTTARTLLALIEKSARDLVTRFDKNVDNSSVLVERIHEKKGPKAGTVRTGVKVNPLLAMFDTDQMDADIKSGKI